VDSPSGAPFALLGQNVTHAGSLRRAGVVFPLRSKGENPEVHRRPLSAAKLTERTVGRGKFPRLRSFVMVLLATLVIREPPHDSPPGHICENSIACVSLLAFFCLRPSAP